MDEATDWARQWAAKVKLLVLDVDGVLTDSGLYYDAEGRVSQRFDVRDGMGVKLAQAAGIKIAAISGLAHGAAKARLTELGVDAAYFGHRDKRPVFLETCRGFGVSRFETAYLGDDWVDAPAMNLAGLPMAVADAQPEIKSLALWISACPGGHGAVREAVRFILAAQGKLAGLWGHWLGEG
ncbi:MAG: phenylphosphate carboxylase subunit delta [Desulfovibrionaceae bacterium]|nr:phenylphosphate carboxylase subunit delta [Desulfovibrionaceae bacterium]MBF0514660.1 phenylphosphate carboxylase subunit delta [Desulfovibrionaceae bacterium]